MNEFYYQSVNELKGQKNNARVHDDKQIEMIENSIREFGFVAPVIVDENNTVLVGHGRIEAAKRMGITSVPCVRVGTLSEDQKRAYVLADNLLTGKGGWDPIMLRSELSQIKEVDLSEFGFVVLENEDVMTAELDDMVVCPKCGHSFLKEEI